MANNPTKQSGATGNTSSATLGLAFSRDTWGRLHLDDAEGRTHESVTLTPLFPITDPHKWIAVCDAQGREIACIADPNELAPKSRAIVNDELSRREFMPVVTRIVHVSGKTEPSEWTVETDRGTTKFVLTSDENVRRLGDDRVAIIDANGVRFLVPSVKALDIRSRRVIEWYV